MIDNNWHDTLKYGTLLYAHQTYPSTPINCYHGIWHKYCLTEVSHRVCLSLKSDVDWDPKDLQKCSTLLSPSLMSCACLNAAQPLLTLYLPALAFLPSILTTQPLLTCPCSSLFAFYFSHHGEPLECIRWEFYRTPETKITILVIFFRWLWVETFSLVGSPPSHWWSDREREASGWPSESNSDSSKNVGQVVIKEWMLFFRNLVKEEGETAGRHCNNSNFISMLVCLFIIFFLFLFVYLFVFFFSF